MKRGRPVPIAALTLALISVADFASFGSGEASSFAAGALDELAHLATGLMVCLVLARGQSQRFRWALLVSSVVIDIDHLPGLLGGQWLTNGTPRPYPHSVGTLLLVALAGLLWRRGRGICAGALLGLIWHLWRDLAEPDTGVALLWPVSDHAFSVSYGAYAVSMAALAMILLVRSVAGGRRGRSDPPPQVPVSSVAPPRMGGSRSTT